MKRLTPSQFETLADKGRVLIAGPSGAPMVIETPDDFIVKKLPIRKDLRSMLFPRAKRFKRNSKRLSKLGFQNVEVKDIFSYPDDQCHVIVYGKVRGRPLSEYLIQENSKNNKTDILKHVARYYGMLHNKGVYCRPTHFGNIIVCPDNSLALIDVQNIRFRFFSLDLRTRSRNFKHIFKYDSDMQHVISFGTESFFKTYMSYCRMGTKPQKIFISLLSRHVPGFFKNKTQQFIT